MILKRNRKGFTLIEMMIAIVGVILLVGAVSYIYVVTLRSWSAQRFRTSIKMDLAYTIEKMARQLREAINITQPYSHTIQFDDVGDSNTYIYYFYNADDPIPGQSFSESSYRIMRSQVIDGSFTYGVGLPMAANIEPPTTSQISYSSNLITLDFTATKADESIRLKSYIHPRN